MTITSEGIGTLSDEEREHALDEEVPMSTVHALPLAHCEEEEPWPSDDARTAVVADRFRGVMVALGLDMDDPNLSGTPLRVARAYGELFRGLEPGTEPELSSVPNTGGYSQIVAVTDIPFHSLCAHHFLPFFGTAHVAYVPHNRLIGLSKIARVVEYYARRPQIQERLTEQVVDLLDRRLHPSGAMVVVEARHFCMEMRGVAKPGMTTTTSAFRGGFKDERTRQQFLDLLRR
jgi:GTP cyclohydrolase IA